MNTSTCNKIANAKHLNIKQKNCFLKQYNIHGYDDLNMIIIIKCPWINNMIFQNKVIVYSMAYFLFQVYFIISTLICNTYKLNSVNYCKAEILAMR